MGRIGRVLSFVSRALRGFLYSDVKVDAGGGQNVTGAHFQNAGTDCRPLPGDRCMMIPIPRSGGFAVIGYIDPGNASEAAPGEFRAYSRASTGEPVAVLWLRSDGSVVIDNGPGQFVMQPSGDIVLNGVTIDTAGNVSAPGIVWGQTDVQFGPAQTSGNTHLHSGVTPGSGNSAGPVPGS